MLIIRDWRRWLFHIIHTCLIYLITLRTIFEIIWAHLIKFWQHLIAINCLILFRNCGFLRLYDTFFHVNLSLRLIKGFRMIVLRPIAENGFEMLIWLLIGFRWLHWFKWRMIIRFDMCQICSHLILILFPHLLEPHLNHRCDNTFWGHFKWTFLMYFLSVSLHWRAWNVRNVLGPWTECDASHALAWQRWPSTLSGSSLSASASDCFLSEYVILDYLLKRRWLALIWSLPESLSI